MLFRSLLGFQVSRLILPAQNRIRVPQAPNCIVGKVRIKRFRVLGTGITMLDGCEFNANTKKVPPSQRKIIIHAEGNINMYESFTEQYIEEAKRLPNCTVVAFNYRGVGHSHGSAHSENDWIEDVIAIVNRYRAQGVPLNNILLNGYSLSGAICSLAAARIYREEKAKAPQTTVQTVRLINNRSFSDAADFLLDTLFRGKPKSFVLGLIGGLCVLAAAPWMWALGFGIALTASCLYSEKLARFLIKPFIQGLLWLTFGTLNGLNAYRELPQKVKDYIFAKDDPNVKISCSLHRGLKPERKAEKIMLRQEINQNRKNRKLIRTLNEKLINLKDCKLEGHGIPNSHLAPLSQLRTVHQLRIRRSTGEEVLNNKTRKLLAMSKG